MVFPKHLLREKNGHPAFFEFLPRWLNRERRREIASRLRKGGIGRAGRTSPEQVFVAWFKKDRERFRQFWRRVQRQETEGASDAQRTLSLDFGILESLFPNFLDAAVEREGVALAYPGLDELEGRVTEKYPGASKVLQPLALWAPTRAQLDKWQTLTTTEREALASTVFALCGITGGSWFLEEAIQRVPDFAELFEIAPARRTQAPQVPATGDVYQEWRASWERLRDLGKRALAASPGVAYLDELKEVSGKLNALRQRLGQELDAPGLIDSAVDELERLLGEAAKKHRWLSLDHEAVVQLTAKWRIAQLTNTKKQDLLADAKRAASELTPLLGEAKQRFEALYERDSQLTGLASRLEETRLPAERRALLEERNRAEVGHLEMLGALETIEKRVLAAAAPLGSPYEASRNYVEELAALKAGEKTAAKVKPVSTTTTPTGITSPTQPPPSTVGVQAGVRPDTVKAGPVATPQGVSPQPVPLAENVEQGSGAAPPPTVPEKNVRSRVEGQEDPAGTAPGDLPPEREGQCDVFSVEAGKLCSPIWVALREGKRALAYQVARALQDTEPGLLVPHLPLLHAAVLADQVQSPSGRLAAELEELYSSFNPGWFNEGPDAWSQGLSLLLVSAALTPALIAPGTGASAVLRYRHVAGNLNSLYALCELVIECGERLQGKGLNPGAFTAHKSIETWNRELDALRKEVSEWRRHAPRMTMKFTPATAVWQRWHRADGVISRLLDNVLTEDVSLLPAATKAMKVLQQQNDFTQLVTRTDRQELQRRRGDDIHAGALTQLRERAAEAVAYVQRWLDLMETRPSQSDYLTRQLGELRQKAARLKPSLEHELNEYAGGVSDGWPLVPAGVACIRQSIQALDSLFEGSQQLREPEVSPELLVGRPLLLAPAVDVDESFKPLEGEQEILPHLLRLLPGQEDWVAAFKGRLERGDAEGAGRILDLPGTLPEGEAIKLAETYRVELEHHRENLRSALKAARDGLEAALAYGYVDEHERSQLDGVLTEVERRFEAVRRFQDARERVELVIQRIQVARDTKVASVKELYRHLHLPAGSNASARLERIISEGDVLTANEYLARLASGESLPEPGEDGRDLFSEFYPAIVRGVDAFLGAPGGGLGSVVALIKGAQDFGGLSFKAATGAQSRSAVEMVEAWQRLKRAEKVDGGGVAAILSAIGFSSPRVLSASATKSECEVQVERLADRTICPVPQYGSQAGGFYRIVCVFKRLTDEDLVRFVSETSGGRATLALYFGRLNEKQRRELSQVTSEKRRTFLLLDEILLLHLAAQPKSRLAVFFHCTLPFTFIEPYITTSGLVAPEMFYGRVDELNAVRDISGRCFIYGGRQLGKTALLREAERSFHSPRDHRVARWIDLKAEGIGMSREPRDIWDAIQREFKDAGVLAKDGPARPNPESIGEGVKQWLGLDPGRRVLLLLDEADRFLEQDGRLEYPETSRLKNLMDVTSRRFKVVFAGLHNVLRTAEQANHPLAHLGDPIEVGPLIKAGEWRFARDLIRYPLGAAGYKFEPDDLIVRILAQTNYYPSLIQLYCAQLLRHLHKPYSPRLDYKDGPRYGITESVVDDTYRSKELREAITSRFQLTLQLDPRYEVVTYAIAYALDERRFSFEQGADSKTIREIALEWWAEGFAKTSEHEFRVLLDEMVGLGVLRHAGERNYSLRNPNVLLLMGTREDIEAALLTEREQPQEFEPNVFRAHLPGDSHDPLRSPMTFGQEHALLRREHGVTVIAGSTAGGLEYLEKFLNARVRSEFLRFGHSLRSRNDLARQMDLLDRRPEGGTTLQVIPQSVNWDIDWARLAVTRVERLRSTDRHVRVVFVADPGRLRSTLPQLRTLLDGLAVELLPVKPWSDNFLRQWLEDIGVTGADAQSRQQLADATGLWPAMLAEARVASRGSSDIARICEVAQGLLVQAETRARILEQLGLRFEDELRVLRVLSDLGELREEEFPDYRDFFETDLDAVLRALQWAEALQLADRPGPRTWRASAFVARLLREPPPAHAK